MKQQNKHTYRKIGFTLIELIIYIGLLSTLLIVLTQTFTSIIQARLDSEATSNVDQDANYILNRLIYDVSRSSKITSPSSYGSASTTALVTINGIGTTYSLNNGVLQLTNNLGTFRLNSINTLISNLQFTKIGINDLDTLKVSFRVTSIAVRASGNDIKDYEITVAPR